MFVVAARLIDLRRLRYAFRASRYDAGLVLATALSAVFVSVEFSILIGVTISILMFVPRASRLRTSELLVSGERVVRERMPWDPRCTAMILWGIEGELFFGAGPELERCFDGLRRRAVEERIRIIVLRLKRTRNPDMVCIERLEHFLKDMQRRGVTVLLCGIWPELARCMENVGFQEWLSPNRIFLEEDEADSATLKAVRYAYELLGDHVCNSCPRKSPAKVSTRPDLHYLV
ncbi:MAG: SulP family inorganic anion transporter [Acetobacteraceae bacterium]|nr:SulP family inorganic anion transporter [Acetobacteraceae bacterium]